MGAAAAKAETINPGRHQCSNQLGVVLDLEGFTQVLFGGGTERERERERERREKIESVRWWAGKEGGGKAETNTREAEKRERGGEEGKEQRDAQPNCC